MTDRLRVTFGKVVGEFPPKTSELAFNSTERVDGLDFGEYTYDSETRFGSSTKCTGEFVYREADGLLGIVTEGDRPSPEKILRTITESDASDAKITVPEYPASASHDFYRTYGINGYTTDFTPTLRTKSFEVVNDPPLWKSPEDVAKERAQGTRQRIDDELVEEVTEEFIEEGYYVSGMDMGFDVDGPRGRFNNPLKFGSIPKDEWNQELFELIVERATELITDDVKTVEELQ